MQTKTPPRLVKASRPVHQSRLRRLLFDLQRLVRWYRESLRRRGLVASTKQLVTRGIPWRYLFLILLAIVSASYLVATTSKKPSSDRHAPSTSEGTLPAARTDVKPSFDTLLPSGRTIEQLGGWRSASPSRKVAAYAYSDHLDGAALVVTQQELPDDFKDKTDEQVKQLAHKLNNKHLIKAGATSVYLGSDSNLQSLVFAKDDRLVFIKTTGPVSDAHWIDYITALK